MLDAIFIQFVLTICFMLMTLVIVPPVSLKKLIDVCEKYSIKDEITYNATETVCMYIRPKHMYHILCVKSFLLTQSWSTGHRLGDRDRGYC